MLNNSPRDNKDLIIQKYNECRSYAETGREFNLTRQRIHQIITGYDTLAKYYSFLNRQISGGWGKSKILRDLTRQSCKCGKKSISFHHLDGNSRNNEIENLIRVCKKCHSLLHTGKDHKGKYDGQYCLYSKCKNRIPIKSYYRLGGKFCNVICRFHYKNPQAEFRIRRDKNYRCMDCGSLKHHAKMRCQNCYMKYLWKTSPKRREYMRKRYWLKKAKLI